MGGRASYVSCCTSLATAKVVGRDGVLRRVEAPAAVIELMMEFPGNLVARADEVALTRRAAGIPPDKELQPGAVYLLLPMDRVGSRLSDQQMEALHDAVRCGGRRRWWRKEEGCERRVFPEESGGEDEKTADLGGEATSFPFKRFGRFRQWIPALGTIDESISD